MPIVIDSQNIVHNEWIWDFLESQRRIGKAFWKPNEVYHYNGTSFTFQQTVFARQRKNAARGCAYEMMSPTCLGSGAFGSVFRISCTISLGKTNTFQAKDKHRVVKYQYSNSALYEYQIARYAKHLHVKAPTGPFLVMKEMPGETLSSLLRRHPLSRQEKLELTKTLAHVIKEQLIEQKLLHKDLHTRNILVAYNPQSLQNPFTANIIDFGLASYRPDLSIKNYNFDVQDFSYIFEIMWLYEPDRPEQINRLLESRSAHLIDYLILDEVVLSPIPSLQKQLDRMLSYLKELAKTHKELAEELRNNLVEAVKHSSLNDLTLIKHTVKQCHDTLIEHHIDLQTFPYPIFTEHLEKQTLFNNICDYFSLLENKGKFLMNTPQKAEGKKLCALVHDLRQKTYDAAMKPSQEQREALVECSEQCKRIVKDNQKLLDIHRDYNYVWAEIGVVFCSLIVLYPIVGGIHYLATGRFRFFNQTESAAGAQKMEKNFNQLNTISAH